MGDLTPGVKPYVPGKGDPRLTSEGRQALIDLAEGDELMSLLEQVDEEHFEADQALAPQS